MIALVSVLLPAPGAPVSPTVYAVAGERMRPAGPTVAGLVAAALDQRQQAGQRRPIAVAGGGEQLRSDAARGRGPRPRSVDVDDFGDAVDAVAHDPLDARLQRLRRAGHVTHAPTARP